MGQAIWIVKIPVLLQCASFVKAQKSNQGIGLCGCVYALSMSLNDCRAVLKEAGNKRFCSSILADIPGNMAESF